jgi:CheY-like chemotaxis protein
MNKRILIVEDDRAEREGLARLLTAEGHQIEAAETVSDANARLSAGSFDVVLLDLHLPGMPGDWLASTLKMKYPRTRIIFMSGEYTMHDPQRFGEDTLYLPKPISPEYLLRVIGEYPAPAAH